ncbi:DddA-like double-stranded DNA deaminase toxin [Amycolatopsis roodepoortensis]|uniref:Uncharacterized protein n=1 Tax=Amycolatopsis roodepoortensis TaxID=700274 RepID=A0ABR9LJN0_9PSEU|nr:DddA-like double-stranded DNA deaminase toxin [Amycolatopsis roodepoortensis]MBE1580495.1 hypothetical protein [Amycolatopsis roodepoortensis]
MASVGEMIKALLGAVEKLDAAHQALEHAQPEFADAEAAYLQALGEAGYEAKEVLTICTSVPPKVTEYLDELRAVRGRIMGYVDDLRGEHGPAAAETSKSDAAARPSSPAVTPPSYTNQHGDAYPKEAAELAALLPKRCLHGAPKQKTVGVPRVNGRIAPPIRSGGGKNDPQVIDAKKLLESLGFSETQADFLKYHVEVKAAALALKYPGVEKVEMAINNTPCGTEQFQGFKAVCDRVLTMAFPSNGAKSLTLHGSYQDNRPFRKHYGRPVT